MNFGHVEVISKGLNWLYIPILALIVRPEVLGEIVLIQSTVAILSSILIFGQNRVVLKYSTPEKSLVFLVSLLIVTGIACLLIFFDTVINYLIYPYVIIATYFITIHTLLSLALRANENLYLFKVVRLTHVFIRLIIGCTLIYIFENPIFYLLGDLIGVIIAFIIYRLLCDNNKHVNKIVKENVKAEALAYFKFGIPLFIQGLVAALSANIDRFILNDYGYKEIMGSYGIIVAISSSIAFILAYYAVIYEVKIYRARDSAQAEIISIRYLKNSIYSSLLITPLLLVVYYIIYCINPALMFYPFVFLTFITCNILMINYCKYTYLCAFSNKTNLILKVSLILAVLLIIFNYLLIPSYGMQGAAWAKLISILITLIFINLKSFSPFMKFGNR
jgi:O-antigen/teichoic acid export membrane protein